MSLLALSGFFVILAECLEASELTKKLVITVGESDRFTASLPDGYDKLDDNFRGYFVKLDDSTGCKKNLTIHGSEESDDNINKFITYIDWPGESGCTFLNVIKNLKSISISHFVLVLDRDEEPIRKVDGANFVLLDYNGRKDDSQTVRNFKNLVSQNGSLRKIEVETQRDTENNSTIPMSSMAILFVTVAFVTLMTVSIGWLVFYYAQRCRQRNMRERMQSRLCVAAKRAVSKLPTKTVPDLPKTTKKIKKSAPPIPDNDSTCSSCSSNEDADFCPVCLDLYKPREVIRILPCKHEFHKNCVDPWLFDHRTCPMCKLDILEHLGMPSGGDTLNQAPQPVVEQSENVSTRVDQEVQTDFVNPPSPQQQHTSSVAVRITGEDEIEPAPISPVPAV